MPDDWLPDMHPDWLSNVNYRASRSSRRVGVEAGTDDGISEGADAPEDMDIATILAMERLATDLTDSSSESESVEDNE